MLDEIDEIIIRLIASEKTNPEIANITGFSLGYIKRKISRMLKIYKVKTKIGLITKIFKLKVA